METDPHRILGYSDIRIATSIAHKAALMVVKYGLAKKATARVLNVNLNVVRKAVTACNEGREIGLKGRPRKLCYEQEAELTTEVEKMIKEHRSPSRRQLASQVRLSFSSFNWPKLCL